jgi:hypothetical protein
MAKPTNLESLDRMRGFAEDLLVAQGAVYPIARQIWAEALGGGNVDEGGPANDQRHAMWLLWGSLTDWVENKPDQAGTAEAAMRRAAHEWLTVLDDEVLWRPYFDRWLYEEMGYARPGASCQGR